MSEAAAESSKFRADSGTGISSFNVLTRSVEGRGRESVLIRGEGSSTAVAPLAGELVRESDPAPLRDKPLPVTISSVSRQSDAMIVPDSR
jgi:hypothetical protein